VLDEDPAPPKKGHSPHFSAHIYCGQTTGCIKVPLVIIRPHRSTTYVDAAYCYRPSSVVCSSICQSVCHSSEPCRNGQAKPIEMPFEIEDFGGPKEALLGECAHWCHLANTN